MKICKQKDSPLAILLKGYEINMKFPNMLVWDKKAIIISLFYFNITIVKLYTMTLTHTHTRLTKTSY